MDPNENLRRQRELAKRILALSDRMLDAGAPDPELVSAADELAELSIALDAWLTSGGAEPDAWTKVRKERTAKLIEELKKLQGSS